jgi:8-oxo-dGTP pyrophosphatase MutT (NUDIX family)
MKTLKFEYTNYKGETRIREVEPLGIKFDSTPYNKDPEWLLEAMDVQKKENSLFTLTNIQRMMDDSVQRFLCVTTYVMRHDGSFLMLFHKKLGKWLPPGGKVDRHETPDEAAMRECFEETGVEIKLVGNRTPVTGGLMAPFGSQLNVINPGARDHVDLIYLATPLKEGEITVSEREASAIGWFSLEEVKKLHTFDSVIEWCSIFSREENFSFILKK